MNACLNLIKAFLALELKNDPNWLLRFLALQASAFLAQIYFFDLAVFDLLAGLYDFSVLVLFYLDFPAEFSYVNKTKYAPSSLPKSGRLLRFLKASKPHKRLR